MNLLAEIPVQIPLEEIKQAPLLDLEVIDAPATTPAAQFKYSLTKGAQFKINARGLVGSKRNKNDGCVFFGSGKPEGGLFINKKEPVNDVVLGENMERGCRRHFIVRYRTDNKGYYLKDSGEGSGTFVRIDRPLVSFLLSSLQILSNGFLISFGESHLVV